MGNIFSFSGRAGRLGYFMVGVVQAAFLVAMFFVAGATLKGTTPGEPTPGFAIVFLLVILVMAWTGLAATTRRLRDMGWPIILGIIGVMFVPFVSLLLLFWPGKEPDFDTAVFSDDPKPTRGDKAAKTDNWMQRAMEQASKGRSSQPEPSRPAPAPRVSGALAAAQGPRTEFGLRR